MRLKEEERLAIVEAVSRHIHPEASTWLFGSRCDDSKHGGDIDLLIETPPIPSAFTSKLNLRMALMPVFGEQKIDILVHQLDREPTAIQQLAKETGVLITTTQRA